MKKKKLKKSERENFCHEGPDVVNNANEQLVRVFSWMTNNKLNVNTAKTKYMIFSPKSRNTKTTCERDTQLKIESVAISEVDNFKFLGVIVSNNLSWKAHMLCVRNKLQLIKLKNLHFEIRFG